MKHEKLIKIKAIPYHSYNMVVYSTKIDEYGELVPYRQMILARRKSSDVLVERNVLRTAYNNNNNEHQGHKMTHLINDMSSSNNNIYLKNTEFVMLKVKPAIVEGIHRFSLIDKTAENIQKFVDQYKQKINYSDSYYAMGMLGERIPYTQWVRECVDEEPHHKMMRRVLKQPNIWRSYPNLYKKAKESIPNFSETGQVQDPFDVLPRCTIPFPLSKDNPFLGLPNNLNYVSASINRLPQLLPTFNSPNVRNWDSHGNNYVLT
tara:strand:- start:704 stop:1489 length:786 start_codon:yes stop_codon:yes gene_type:complete